VVADDTKVEVEPAPPSKPSEPVEGITKSAAGAEPLPVQVALLLGERIVYFIVGLMLFVGLFVNLWIAYWHANSTVLPRFTADAEFLLAAGAILLIAFELRKERIDSERREREDAQRALEQKHRDERNPFFEN
jgi:hypothetical protein